MIIYNTGPLLQKLCLHRERVAKNFAKKFNPVFEDIVIEICLEVDELLIDYQGNRPMPQDVYNNAVELLTEISFYR